MSNPGNYSTLEVHDKYSQLPEVVDHEQFQKEAVVGQQPPPPPPIQYASSGQYPNGGNYVNGVAHPYPPADGYYAPVPPHAAHSPTSPYSQGTYESHPGGQQNPHGAYAVGAAPIEMGYGGSSSPPSQGTPTDYNENEKKPGRRICGVAPMTFWISLAVIVAIIVAAVVGGVVGSLTSSKGNDDAQGAEGEGGESSSTNADGDANDSKSDMPLLHVNSRLTATNWTGPDGTTHRAVFFQDAYDAIIACQWDSEEKKWAKTNISELLAPSTLPLRPVSGTPLASASIDNDDQDRYEIRLWYLDADSVIRSVGRADGTDSANRWLTDTLDDAFLQTRPGSLLSAAWQRPGEGHIHGNWVVAYQRPSDGAVKVANSSHWDVSDVAIERDAVVDNSSLAVIPTLDGPYPSNIDIVSQGLSQDTTGTMQLSSFEGAWDFGEFF